MRRSSRLCAVFLLVLLLLPAALQAAEPLQRGSFTLLSWDVLARVWSFLTSSQGDNGCELDPDGRCRQRSTATSDNGCEFDPSGRGCTARQVSPATVDNGCEVDPDGRRCRLSAVTVDNGCEVDPNGRCRN